MINIEAKITKSIKNKVPFVLFRKPNTIEINTVFQKNNLTFFTEDFTEKGFVFAPFNDANKTLIIPFLEAEKEIVIIKDYTLKNTNEFQNSTSIQKEFHINLVKKGIKYINDSDADKIVLSRKEVLEINNFNIFEIYKELLSNYSTAYVYLWFHPETGIWLGATPERLLSVKNNKFKVMALASTQIYEDTLDVVWGEKEQQEHQFVVDYIVSQLKEYNLNISKTYTVKAGSLLHLRADVLGAIDVANFSLRKVIKSLHPTPATCGFPKELSKKFILENENYNREYYTGFLGEITQDSADLYVNLRCMKFEQQKNKVSLFIGGGITKNSIPEKEWEETVAKSKVMKKVL